MTAFGDYDQCVDIDHIINGHSVGKHCWLKIHILIPLPSEIALNESTYENSLIKTIVNNFMNYRVISNGIYILSVCKKPEMAMIFKNGKYILCICIVNIIIFY